MDAKTKEYDWTASMIEFLKTIDHRKSYSPDFLAKYGIETKDKMSRDRISGEDVIELVAAKIVEEDRINPPNLENYRSIEEFCQYYDLNEKTVRRYRRKGLVTRFLDRLVITDEDFRDFENKTKLQIEQVWKHQPLSEHSKQSISYVYDRLLAAKCPKPNPIITEVTGRTADTVKRVISTEEVDEQQVFYDLQHYPVHLIIRKHRLSQRSVEKIQKDKFLSNILSLDLNFIGGEDQPQEDREYGNLLSEEDEKYLFKRLNYLKKLAGQEREQGKYSECWQIYDEIMEIREILARCNQPLLKKVKSKAIGAHPTLDDQELFSEMQISLLRSIKNFNISLGNKFSTYLRTSLINCLRKEIERTQKHRNSHSQLNEEFNEVASYAPKINIIEELEMVSNTQRQLLGLVSGISTGKQMSIRSAAKQLDIDLGVAERAYQSAVLTLKSGLEK